MGWRRKACPKSLGGSWARSAGWIDERRALERARAKEEVQVESRVEQKRRLLWMKSKEDVVIQQREGSSVGVVRPRGGSSPPERQSLI